MQMAGDLKLNSPPRHSGRSQGISKGQGRKLPGTAGKVPGIEGNSSRIVDSCINIVDICISLG